MISFLRLLLDKLREGYKQLPFLWRALRFVYDAAGKWTIAWIILLVFQGLLPAITVSLTRELVDSLVVTIDTSGDWDAVRLSLIYALSMGLVLLLQELISGLISWVGTSQGELVRDYISSLLHRQSISVDLAFYDSHEYFDHLYRARFGAADKPLALLESLGRLLQNAVTMVAMAVLLISYAWWLPFVLIISTFPALFVVLEHTKRQYEWDQRTTADRRRVSYYEYLLTARAAAAELRLFGLGEHFMSRFQAYREHLRNERLSLIKGQSIASLIAGLFALIIMGLTMAWMVWQSFQGRFTLGDLALFYSAFNQGQKLMRTVLQDMGQIYRNMLFLGNLFEFLELESEIVDEPEAVSVQAPQEGIRFENVSFSYPESERTVLQDFNLDIRAEDIVAVVGVNGAGKSTLLKLICRFYDPIDGQITWDGTDLRDYSLLSLRRSISVIFQQPVPYQNTVSRNIEYGDLAGELGPAAIETAAMEAGADSIIERLPDGYKTQLGRWFKGGTDLSVGEWQRIALARAFLRQAPIIILDEPTSAMDPWAEVEWLHRFRKLAAGKTAIIITHRFTTAMHADVIHVMDDGHIIESGSHEELLAMDGRYAESWRAQMQGRK